MTGFEKTKFVSLPEGMEEELTCAICMHILNTPMTSPCCRTSYCRKCINDYLLISANFSPTCPSCRANLSAANLQPLPVFVNNNLNKLEVYCDNDINGCTQIIKFGELSQYLTRCPFDPNSPTLKSSQLFKNINQRVDRLQSIMTKEVYDNLRKGLDDIQKEMVKICSADNLNNSSQMTANTSTVSHSQPHNNILINYLNLDF